MNKKLLTTLAPLAVATQLAHAQGPRLEEVIVTATKTAENLQSVPSAVSAFSSDKLAEAGVKDLQDLSGISPGLAIQSSGGGESTVIRLRGMGSQRFDQSVAQFVGVFIDEITQHRPGVAMAALMDVERVEVLRGPQNVLYGKNVPAGAISIVSKRPDLSEFGGDASYSIGNHDYREQKLNLNIPLVPGVLAARVGGLNSHRTGETDVEPAGQTWGGSNRTGGRLALLFQPSEDFTVNATYLNYKSKAADFQQISQVDYVVNNPFKYFGFIPGDPGELVPGVVPAHDLSPLNDPTAMPALGLGKITVAPIDPFRRKASLNDKYRSFTDLESTSLQADYSFGDHTLAYLAGYQEYTTGGAVDSDGTDVSYSHLDVNLGTRYWSQELRWTYSGDRIETMAGVFIDEERHSSYTTVFVAPLAPYIGLIIGDDTYRDIDSRSVFFRVSYDLSDDLRLAAGARYSQSETSVTLRQLGDARHTEDFNSLVGEATLSYQWTPDLMTYLKIGTGNQSGGINMAVLSNPALQAAGGKPVFDEAKSKYAEVGVKSSLLDNSLQINANAFYQIYDGYQSMVALDALNTYIANAGKVQVQGLELDTAWQATDNLRFDNSVAVTDARFRKFDNAPCSELQLYNALFSGDFGNSCVVSGNQDLAGKRVNESPLLSLTSALTHTSQLHALGAQLSLRGELSYRSETVSENFIDTDNQRQGGYTLLNASASLDWDNGLRLMLWGKNLGDKDYCLYRQVNTASISTFVGSTCLVGAGREYGLTANYRWD